MRKDELLDKIYELKDKYLLAIEEGKIIDKNIYEWGKVNLTYNSNAIEGNTLTEMETKIIIEDGLSIKGKKLVELQEAQNHAKAIDYIKNLKNIISANEINQKIIMDIHSIILRSIDDENAGSYRNCAVRISGSEVILPNYMKLNDLMDDLDSWLSNYKGDIVQFACDLHYRFVSIHPFVDGNGRTARLLFNLALMIDGFPLITIQNKHRKEYLDSLEKAQLTGDMEEYYEFMYGEIVENLEKLEKM